MHDGGFRMLRCHVGVTGLAVSDGLLQFLDALIKVRILDASSLRMFQRLFRVLRHGIGMALLPVIYRPFGMLNSFIHVFVVSLGH